jgi:hypothetical protein
MTVQGSYLEVAYSQRVEVGEPSLNGASPANVHGGAILDLNGHVEAAKRVDDWGSTECSPLHPGYHHVSHQTHYLIYLSVEMHRDCTEALEMELTKGRE